MTVIVVPHHLDDPLADHDWPLPADLTVSTDAAPEPSDRWGWLASLYESVAQAVSVEAGAGRVPVVLSGDCTTSLGVVAGLQRAGTDPPTDPAIVWFDAHGDVQTVETTASGYLGGMPLRILVGYRPELIADRLGIRPVPEERVVLVDARDLDPPEVEYLSAAAVRHVPVADVSTMELPPGPIYLHLDLDVVNPDQLPGLLFPAAGGPGMDAVFEAIRGAWATGRVVALGLACTWRSGHGAGDAVRPHVAAMLT